MYNILTDLFVNGRAVNFGTTAFLKPVMTRWSMFDAIENILSKIKEMLLIIIMQLWVLQPQVIGGSSIF